MSPKVESVQLPVMEAFETVQGEGHHTGTPAYFIRLGGCDVGCHWCDVKESWDPDLHPKTSVEEIVSRALEFKTRVAIITGGEPLMYDLDELTTELKSSGFNLNIETSGAYPLTGTWDWICFSPKKFKTPKEEFYSASHELKVIVYNRSDLRWADDHADKMNEDAQLFLQPEWSREKEMLPLIVEHVKQNPRWRISLQTHKYIGIP